MQIASSLLLLEIPGLLQQHGLLLTGFLRKAVLFLVKEKGYQVEPKITLMVKYSTNLFLLNISKWDYPQSFLSIAVEVWLRFIVCFVSFCILNIAGISVNNNKILYFVLNILC